MLTWIKDSSYGCGMFLLIGGLPIALVVGFLWWTNVSDDPPTPAEQATNRAEVIVTARAQETQGVQTAVAAQTTREAQPCYGLQGEDRNNCYDYLQSQYEEDDREYPDEPQEHCTRYYCD